jgi:hypothetical protein
MYRVVVVNQQHGGPFGVEATVEPDRSPSGGSTPLGAQAQHHDMPDPQPGSQTQAAYHTEYPGGHAKVEEIASVPDGVYPADPEIDAIGYQAEARPTADPGGMAPTPESQPDQQRQHGSNDRA